MDILFEENKIFLHRDYSGRNIYKQNTDSYTDHQIYTMTHRMLMYSIVHNGDTNKSTAAFLTYGFTSILKGQWINFLQMSKVL